MILASFSRAFSFACTYLHALSCQYTSNANTDSNVRKDIRYHAQAEHLYLVGFVKAGPPICNYEG